MKTVLVIVCLSFHCSIANPASSENFPTKPPICDFPLFACAEGLCLPRDWVCDGERDCQKGDDEENCTETTTMISSSELTTPNLILPLTKTARTTTTTTSTTTTTTSRTTELPLHKLTDSDELIETAELVNKIKITPVKYNENEDLPLNDSSDEEDLNEKSLQLINESYKASEEGEEFELLSSNNFEKPYNKIKKIAASTSDRTKTEPQTSVINELKPTWFSSALNPESTSKDESAAESSEAVNLVEEDFDTTNYSRRSTSIAEDLFSSSLVDTKLISSPLPALYTNVAVTTEGNEPLEFPNEPSVSNDGSQLLKPFTEELKQLINITKDIQNIKELLESERNCSSANALLEDKNVLGKKTCPHQFQFIKGDCVYIQVYPPMTWYEALSICNSQNGHLLVIKSVIFFEGLIQQLNFDRQRSYSFWIGATNYNAARKWQWVDQTPVNNFKIWGFLPGVSHHGEYVDNTVECGFLDGNLYSFVNKADCMELKGFVCQIRTLNAAASYQAY